MQDSGLYNELDEKQMVRYSDIVKGSITKYEGLKDETETNTYTSVEPSTNGNEDVPNDKYERLEGESEKNIYIGILKTDTPKYISVIDDDREGKEGQFHLKDKVGEDEDGYLKPGSRNSQEIPISPEKNKDSIENYLDGYLNPVSNDTVISQVTSSLHIDRYSNPDGKSERSMQGSEGSSVSPVRKVIRNEGDKDEANYKHSHETEKDNPSYISVTDDDSEGKKETANILPKDIHTKDNIQHEVNGYLDPVSKDTGSRTQASQHASNANVNGYLNSVETKPSCEQNSEFSFGCVVPKTPENEDDDDGYLEPTEEHAYETPTSSETGDSGIPDDDIGSCHTADTELNDGQMEVPHEYSQPYEFSNTGFTIARQSYMAPVTRTHWLVMENDKDVEDGCNNKDNEQCVLSQEDDYLSLNIDHNYTKLN